MLSIAADAAADGDTSERGSSSEPEGVRSQLALAYVAAAASLKLLIMLPHAPSSVRFATRPRPSR